MSDRAPWLKRFFFGGKTRCRVYQILSVLLENNVILIEALREVRDVFNEAKEGEFSAEERASDNVKCKTFAAEAIQDWILHLKRGDASGSPLSRAMARWVPHEEAALIQAGEATSDLPRMLRDAVSGIKNQGAMLGAILSGTVYPAVLFGGAYFVMRLVSNDVMPPFIKQVDPEQWEGPAYALYLLSQAFVTFGFPLVVAAVVIGIGSVVSLPLLRGPVRVFLDTYIPPWTIYRMVQGASFLRGIAVQTRAGIKVFDSLSSMSAMASPWLRERLEATMYGVQQGANLGEALNRAEYNFPDPLAIKILRVLASRDKFDETIYNFAGEWQAEALEKVKAASAVFLVAGILAIGVVGGTTISGMQSLAGAIEERADSAGMER